MSLLSVKQIIDDIGGIEMLPEAIAAEEPMEEIRRDLRRMMARLEQLLGVEPAYPATLLLLKAYHEMCRMQSEQRKAAGGAR